MRRPDHHVAQTRALHWYNPLVWWAVRRLDLEAECACDDAVIREGLSSSEYAGLLVRAARPVGFAPTPSWAGFGSAPVVKRLEALASPTRRRGSVLGGERWLLALAAAALLPAAAAATWASSRRAEPLVILLEPGTLVIERVSPNAVEVHRVPRER